MVKTLIAFLLLFIFCTIPTIAVTYDGPDINTIFRFSHLSASDGLASQRVFSIVEGSDHAIWIATKNGVERYNGVSMQQYDIDTEAIRYSELTSRIIKLYKSKQGELYAFTNSGKIFRYDIVSNSFVPCCDVSRLFSQDIILNDISVSGGTYWLGLNVGLFSYKDGGKAVAKLRNSFVNNLTETRKGLFVGTNDGLFFTDFGKQKATLLFPHLQVLSSYYDESARRLWIGTFNDGLLKGDITTRTLLPQTTDIPHKPIRAITPYDDKIVIVGVDGGGIAGVFRQTGKVNFHLSTDDEDGAALHGNGVYAVCRDEWGNLWTGTYSGGVDIAYAVDNALKVVSHEYLNEQSLFNNNVNTIIDDGKGNIYFATDRGVSTFHSATGLWTHSLTAMVCLSLARDVDGKILVATYGGGVRTIDDTAVYTKENGKLKTDYVFSLYNDGAGHMWIGCLDGDLALVSGGSVRYMPIQNVQSIAPMPDGRVAIATANGFYAIDKAGRQSHYFTAGEFASRDVNVYVMSMLFTAHNEVWLATDGGGVYIYNMRLHSFRQLTTKDGLPSNSVKGLLLDRMGRIWITTDHGMAYITRKPTFKVVAVNIPHGEGVEFNRNATAVFSDGRLVFGSTSGGVIVNTDALKDRNYKAPILLRDIIVSGLDREKAAELRPEVYEMLSKGKVVLPYSHNTFTLTFESINLKYQYDIEYQYYIEGQRDNALLPVNDGSILFNSLSPGSYRIHLRSVSKSSGQVISERVVDIRIKQPWWNSVWAWIAYLCIIGIVTYYVWRFYRNRLQRQYDAERINFFVNTAHDIRTPLSLTLAPLDDMAKDDSLSPATRNYLDIARRNGKQLMTLIATLLDFQKIDTRKTQLNIKQLDLHDLLEHACSRFNLISEQKHVTLSFDACPEGAMVWMDEKAANRILDNLISNAIKYSRDNGKVEVGAKEDDSHFIIYVRDNGIGIPEKSQKKIFRSFYRAENAVKSKITGTGLGLSLVRSLVAMHKGTVTFESQEGKGTTFFVTLPKGYEMQVGKADSVDKTDSVVGINSVDSIDSKEKSEARNGVATLLFVDDNAELRNYISLTFGKKYDVIAKPNAQSALDYLADNTCDIIVSDVMMPGMQGDEFCRKVKENEATSFIPVILLTAKVGRDYAIDGLNCGADDYISKPFDTEVLDAKIASILRNRQAVRDYFLHRAARLVHEESVENNGSADNNAVADKAKEENSSHADAANLSNADKEFIDKATHIVLENMHDENFDINSLCREMAMSRTLFYGRLKALTGQAPQDFLRMLRLERAAKLLDEGKSVFEASTDTGFANTKYFSTLFKKYFGVSPSKYHKE